MTRKNDRNAIAAIQIARKQLEPYGLDESAYRALVRRVSAAHGQEVDSSARCTPTQRRAILDELQRQGARTPGAKKPANYPGKPHNFHSSAMPEMVTKIEAQLADMGLSWAYADAIAKRQCGIPRVAWVRDQEQLRDEALRLKKKGVSVLLSNSSAPEVKELYKQGFKLIPVQASRAVNSKTSGRGKVTELLIK